MDFSPVDFALQQIKIDSLADSRGRFIMSIVAALQTDDEAETVASKVREDENCVLEWLRRQPGISLSGIATKVGWNTPKGLPNPKLPPPRTRKAAGSLGFLREAL